MGTGLHSVEDGDDKPTSGVAGSATREDPSDLALLDTPWGMGECEERRGLFPRGFPYHVEDFSHSHIFTVISTASGEALQPRHIRGSRPPGGGGAIIRDSKG